MALYNFPKCCGNCMHHVPSKGPIKITSGKSKGEITFWVCDHEECKQCGKGTMSEDGSECDFYEDKYQTYKLLDEWRSKVNRVNHPKKKKSIYVQRF